MATIRKLRGKWQAMVRRKGLAPRAKSFEKKADAERWARDLEVQVDASGVLPDTRQAEQTTLADVLRRYRDEVTPQKRGAEHERIRINALIRRDICHRTLTTLTSADLSSYRDQRLKTVGPATVIRELATISHALDVAQREWGIHMPRNPVKLVRRPSPPRGRTRRLEGEEHGLLLDACAAGRNPWMEPLIVLAIETAMRRGELLSLCWENIDLVRRVAFLPMTKNGECRAVPLSSRAIAALEPLRARLDAPEGLVFPLSPNAVKLAWQRIRERAGLPDLHFHDLRHEAVSRLFEKGLGITEVSTISGHKELRMLQRYTHLRAEDLALKLG
jgi:integrase